MLRRGGVLFTLLATMAAVLAGGAVTGHAQSQSAPAATTTTTPATTTTTVAPDTASTVPQPPLGGGPVNEGSGDQPVAPPPASEEPQPDTGPVKAPPDPVDHPIGSGHVPSGSNSTAALLEALRVLENMGFAPEEAAIAGMGHFPVAGYATFSDDWHDPRGTPEAPRLHMGTDIFAHFGTPVRAPFDGVVRFGEEGLGGKAAHVTRTDGTFYYMAHLMAFADLPNGSSVKQGQVVGLVGDSGNAVGGAPHVHFEIHPAGGAAVNPKPSLDAWLGEALVAVKALVPSYEAATEAGPSSIALGMGLARRYDGRPAAGQDAAEAAPPLWASPVSPAGSAMRVAEAQAERAAASIDWEKRAREQRRRP